MGLFGKLFRLVEGPGKGMGVEELARRLDMPRTELENAVVAYREFHIPKRGNRGTREIAAPEDALKNLQRRLLRMQPSLEKALLQGTARVRPAPR